MPSAIVIGGGPAGSVASILLARAGWHTTLVEQHRFPRDKVCGECLSALGAEALGRVDVFDQVTSRGGVRLNRTLLHAPSGATAAAQLPRPMWGISRIALDGLLVDTARRAGAQIVQPARCEGVDAGPPPSVRLRDLVTNGVGRCAADYVIVADGKAALCDHIPRASGNLGIKGHFQGVDGPHDAIELFGLSGCYGGLAPIEGGRWNCALSVPAWRVRQHCGDLAALFADLLRDNPVLHHRLAAARQSGPWLASPLPRFRIRPVWPERVIPIGNAVSAIEPIGGEGMGLAIRSAELAVEAILRGETGMLRRRYDRLWGVRGLACRVGGALASRRLLAHVAAATASRFPAPLRNGMALMGK